MLKNYYIVHKSECNVIINKIPIWFKEVKFDGDQNNGTVFFHTYNDYNEDWGPNAKIEMSWEKKDRTSFYHPREVQTSIDIYNAINVVVTDKEMGWIQSHEFTIWQGRRNKMIRKKYYVENCIHGIFYCDISERIFSMHATIIKEHYEGFKPHVIECYNSIACH